MRLAAVVAGIALLVGLGGCSSGDAEVTEGGAASASAVQTTTYTSEKYGFSFEYAPPFEEKSDTTWEAQSDQSSSDTVAVFDTTGTQVADQYRDAFVVNVYQLNTEITDANLEQVAAELEQSVLPELQSSSPDMQISELISTEVNGLKGYQADATFSVEGTPMTSTLYFLFDGSTEYQLLTQSGTDRWGELQPTFEQMVQSFKGAAPAASGSPTG